MSRTDQSKTVSLQANFAQGKRGAGPYTIQFSIGPQLKFRLLQGGNPTQAEATIDWSVEGNTIRRVVSVSNGMSVSGVAQAVRVVVNDTTLPNTPAQPGDYLVEITVAPGTRPGSNIFPTLMRAVNSTLIGAGLTITIPIPEGIGISSISVPIASVPGGPIPDQGLQVKQGNTVPTDFVTYDPRTDQWVPLFPGATVIRLTNNTAFQILAMVIFGIDG